MLIYNYHKDTNEFIGATQAKRDPLEPSRFLVPANATTVQPPTTAQREIAIFNGSVWSKTADYRGVVYWLADRSKHEITELGVSPPPEALFVDPGPTPEEVKAANRKAAMSEQEGALRKIEEEERRIAKGLAPLLSEADRLKLVDYAKKLDADILAPSEELVYNPPLPPSIGELDYKTIKILVERVPGWQGALGWKATIRSMDESFAPTNLAMAWYSSPDCTNYVATTGAFQQDSLGTWYATCPAGHEPGDTDIHLGLLLASAPMACFTLLAGEVEKDFLAYE